MVPFTIIKLDKSRKIRFSISTMCEFEKTTGIKLQELEKEMSITTCMKILWVMLKQEDESLTFKDTLKLVDDYAEDLSEVMETVINAIQTSSSKTENPGTIPNVEIPKG